MRSLRIIHFLTIAVILSLLFIAMPAQPAQAQSVVMDYYSGEVGKQVWIQGTGFTAGSLYTITFYNTVVGFTHLLPQGPVATGGLITVTFAIPECPKATYNVQVIAGGGVATTTFTVMSNIELDETSAEVGAEVKMSGTGFTRSTQVSILFDNEEAGTTETNSLGSFTDATFTVPESSRVSHTVKAKDTGNYYDTASFTTLQSITISPTSGTIGDTITVSGTGFGASKAITLSFNGSSVATSQSNTNGSFTGSFNVPSVGSGTYEVTASDATYEASADFTAAASASISETEGYPGDEVTISGKGFAASKTIIIYFDEEKIHTAQTDSKGSFSTSFFVPSCLSGTYKVKVSDGTNEIEFNFIVELDMQLDKTSGHVGTELTISGVGFFGVVTIKYDDTEVATANVQTNGTFRATFNAPVSKHGPHPITVSDGSNTLEAIFIMESTPPSTPQPLLPEMEVKTEATTYFDWTDVTDDSLPVTYDLQIASEPYFILMVLEKTGLTDSDYTLTEAEKLEKVSKETPYYWRVKTTDAASNESAWTGAGSFYVGFTFELPQWGIYGLIGLGGVLLFFLGLWAGRKTSYY